MVDPLGIEPILVMLDSGTVVSKVRRHDSMRRSERRSVRVFMILRGLCMMRHIRPVSISLRHNVKER